MQVACKPWSGTLQCIFCALAFTLVICPVQFGLLRRDICCSMSCPKYLPMHLINPFCCINHQFQVAIEQKLPSLYLMDSIIKNIGKEYIAAVSPCIVALFTHVFEQVHLLLLLSYLPGFISYYCFQCKDTCINSELQLPNAAENFRGWIM